MFRGIATIEEGWSVYEVQTSLCDSIQDVVKEVARLGKCGRIASCNIWVRVKKTWTCIKSVTLD